MKLCRTGSNGGRARPGFWEGPQAYFEAVLPSAMFRRAEWIGVAGIMAGEPHLGAFLFGLAPEFITVIISERLFEDQNFHRCFFR